MASREFDSEQRPTTVGLQNTAVPSDLPTKISRREARERNKAVFAARKDAERRDRESRALARAEMLTSPAIGASRRGVPFEPTPEQRRLVRNMAGIGCTQEECLTIIPWGAVPITLKTFQKHFGEDFSSGKIIAGSRVKKAVYDLAVGSETERPQLGAAQYFLGVVHRWRLPDAKEDGAVLGDAQQTARVYLPAKVQLPPLPSNAPLLLLPRKAPPTRS